MSDEIEKVNKVVFDSIKHADERGGFWYGRELGEALGYTNWKTFEKVINRAKISMQRTGTAVDNHFEHVFKKAVIGYGNERSLDDVRLTRFACYIIAQNGNPTIKPKIAEAQSYFATQTRKRELEEQYQEDVNRLSVRQEYSVSDKRVSSNILEAGVSPRGLGIIKSEGNKDYFGGKTSEQINQKLGIEKKKPWADKASNVVLAGKTLANELTASDIEDGASSFPAILGLNKANNKEVRKTIIKQRGIAPEDHPPAEDTETIKKRVERRGRGLLE